MPATFRPATDRQKAFIARLRQERNLEPAELSGLTSREASLTIDRLMATPRPGRTQNGNGAPRQPAAANTNVPDGYFAIGRTDALLSLPGDSQILFFRVNTGERGRWAGFQFVDQLSGENKWSVRGRDVKAAVLRSIERDVQGAMYHYGQQIGRCGLCNRRLTDDDSRAMGIGPDCFEKLHGRGRTVADMPAAQGASQTKAAPTAPAAQPQPVQEHRSGARATRMATRLHAAISAGTPGQIIEDGIREDEILTDQEKRTLLNLLGQLQERSMQEMEASGDRRQTIVEETGRAISRARAEGDHGLARRLAQDESYVRARREELGW